MSQNLSALSSSSVVRFYLRTAEGRFSSIRCIYMPRRNQERPGSRVRSVKSPIRDGQLQGHLVYLSCGGRNLAVKTNVEIPVSAINWGSFKVVK